MVASCKRSRSDMCIVVSSIIGWYYVRGSSPCLGVESGEVGTDVLYCSILDHSVYLSAFSIGVLVT